MTVLLLLALTALIYSNYSDDMHNLNKEIIKQLISKKNTFFISLKDSIYF